MVAADPEKAERGSTPSAVNNKAEAKTMPTYKGIYKFVKCAVLSSTFSSPSFIAKTALGCCICLMFLSIDFAKTTIRSTLIPPDVEPAQAHCKVKKSSNNWARAGHTALSAVANPVEVPMEMI